MITDWLKALMGQGGQFNITDFLRQSLFDELVELDLLNNRQRNISHLEDKLFVPIMEGTYDALYRFMLDQMVNPEDHSIAQSFLNPDDMLERLEIAGWPGVLETELRFRLLDGGWQWCRLILVSGRQNGIGEGLAYLYVFDIQHVKERELGMTPGSHSAIHLDELTGLPLDRDFFPMARRKLNEIGDNWCVIAVDIEHFKLFTDWHGKAAGDMLLAQLGKMLKRMEEECGALAGYHGLDDFWLMMPYDVARINRLYEDMRAAIVARSNTVGFLPVFGICMIVDRTEEITDMFNHAAMTAEQVKGDLHNRIRLYNAEAYSRTLEEYRMLADFQRGLENREVFFCLQPQCRVSTGAVVGAESLARWRRADGHVVPPAEFVPVLEKYGMVTNLDQYIWDEVCKWLKGWIDAGHTAVPISVNISQIDMLTIDVPRHFSDLLKRYDLPASLIKVEITESAYADDTATVRETVFRLREMGFLVLMDDFGSGYSSLNMLKSLNVDVIKLDAQFLHIQIQEERKGISILESIVNMAKTMKLPIIVEGVETQEQINFLSDLGCRYMQGYFFHRPMPVDEFEEMIRDESILDLRGFEFKANEQIHPREFLDENMFSDAMLNNILGPVAFYCVKDGHVSVERYNQQYYLMVGIPIEQLNERINSIERYIYPDDVPLMLDQLKQADQDHLNGARCVVRVYRPNGTLRWIEQQLYFLSEDSLGRHYYSACEDVTELQFINTEIPGGYFRCEMNAPHRFQFLSHNFLETVGYTEQEIREEFDYSLEAMLYPEDVRLLNSRVQEIHTGRFVPSEPYRMRHKTRGFIYVVMQTINVEHSGEVCLMSVATDVTEMVTLRNQMRLLSKYLTDSIFFLQKLPEGWKHYVIVNGLEEKLGLDAQALERVLDSGEFYAWLDEESRVKYHRMTMEHLESGTAFDFDAVFTLPSGITLPLHLKMDRVADGSTSVEYICVMRAI